MFRAIKIVGTIVSFLVGSIGTLHRMDKQGQVDPVAVEEESTQMVRNIFEKLLKMAGVTVEVRGYENIPQDRPVLYVGNHRSYFDILVGYTTVPGLMGFVAKKEMEKIPLLSNGCSMSTVCFRSEQYKRRFKNDSGGDREGAPRRFCLDFSGGNPQ